MSKIFNAETTLYGIFGKPIKYSRSPLFYNVCFEVLGKNSVFLAFELDKNDTQSIVESIKALDIKGASITMPFKSSVIEFMDKLSPSAKILKAINVIENNHGKLIGHNTDGLGLVKSLDQNKFSYKNERVVLAGLGGAGRAIALELVSAGINELVIAVLDNEKSIAEKYASILKDIVHHVNIEVVSIDEKTLIQELNKNTAIYINSTPVGMTPKINRSLINDFSQVPSAVNIVDIIYSPSETKLSKLANKNNNNTINGLQMLYNQAAESFKIWTGIDIDVSLISSKIKNIKNIHD